MKCFNLFIGVLSILLVSSCTKSGKMEYPLMVEKPFVSYSTVGSVTVEKVELTDSLTVLTLQATDRRFNFSKGCHLVTNTGVELPVLSVDGIELDSVLWKEEVTTLDFKFTFAPMPKDAKSFDFVECEGGSCYNFYGIYFSSEKPDIELPKEWQTINYNEDKELPLTVFSKDPAVLKGYVSGYRPEMDMELKLYYSPMGDGGKDLSVFVGEDDTFEAEVMPYVPCVAYLVLQNFVYRIIVTPGQTVSVMIEAMSLTDESYSPDFKGYLAKTQYEINAFSDDVPDFGTLLDFDLLKDDVADEVVKQLDKAKEMAYGSIDALSVGEAYKQLCKLDIESSYLAIRSDFRKNCRNYCMDNAGVDSREKYMEFIHSYVAPSDEVCHSLKENVAYPKSLDKPYLSLSDVILNLYYNDKDFFPEVKNEKNAEYLEANALMFKFSKKGNLSPDEMAKFDSFEEKGYKELLLARQAEKKAKEEALKKNKSVHLHELDEVASEKTLETILSSYKGKAVFVDIWATWCAPCKAAHKTILPLKADLKDEDIVFVYITGTTSPLDKWSDMIPEISGEHYYLTQDQYKTIMDQYESQGVPTYLIFNKKGEFVFKSVGYPGNDTLKEKIMVALGK